MGEKMDLRFNPSHSSWWFLVRAVAKDNGSEPGAVSSQVSWWVTGGGGGGLYHQSLLVSCLCCVTPSLMFYYPWPFQLL